MVLYSLRSSTVFIYDKTGRLNRNEGCPQNFRAFSGGKGRWFMVSEKSFKILWGEKPGGGVVTSSRTKRAMEGHSKRDKFLASEVLNLHL